MMVSELATHARVTPAWNRDTADKEIAPLGAFTKPFATVLFSFPPGMGPAARLLNGFRQRDCVWIVDVGHDEVVMVDAFSMF